MKTRRGPNHKTKWCTYKTTQSRIARDEVCAQITNLIDDQS